MEKIIGVILIIVGILMQILAILVWVGVITPPQMKTLGDTNQWDVLLELLKKAPWTAAVGLALIYFGYTLVIK